MNFNNFYFNRDIISERLISFNSQSRIRYNDENFTNSAILFLLMAHKNKPYDLVLMRRTIRDGDKHAGEICFPGGVFDKRRDKTLMDTAIRETYEELGIPKNQISLLGTLNDHITPKFFIITPFVGYIQPDQKMVKEELEVDEIICIPISFFTNKKNYQERSYKLWGDNIAVGKYVYNESESKKYTIFGATSHIIVHYIDIVYNITLKAPGHRRICCEDLKRKFKIS
ncbi:MAG: CoA pyrophosphatase [Promethearchaeota archaeon]|nr:MAG: CoA pyrophosphatase [Candidatus Lokiarchaeota archaeon]